MKKYLWLCPLLALLARSEAQTLTSVTVYSISFCAGSPFSVAFSETGTFNSGNVFTAQLSDAQGSFNSPLNIGTLTAPTGSIIYTTMPNGISGSAYRIRVTSSNPAVTSPDNGISLTVHAPPAPMLYTRGSGCPGSDTLVITGAADAWQINWYQATTPIDTVYAVPADTGVTVAGGNGPGPNANQLNAPNGVYVDSVGNIYVGDLNNNRVQMFPAGSTSYTNAVTVAGGNGQGNGATQLYGPTDIHMDGNGNLYVADAQNSRIQKFPPGSTSATSGTTIAGGNGSGGAADQLSVANALYVDGSGNVYVADGTNHRIQRFPAGSTSATPGRTVAGGNGSGMAANQLYDPAGVHIDASGYLYIGDENNDRIQKFPPGSDSATNGVTIAGGNGSGSNPNQLYFPGGVFTDAAGRLYVADYFNNRVQKFPGGSSSTTPGATIAGGNGSGGGTNQLWDPSRICMDRHGNVYVTDWGNNRVQRWSQGVADSLYIPLSTGLYTATYTTWEGCRSPVSNIAQFYPVVTAAVNITVTGGTQSLCGPVPVTVTAVPTNGGMQPVYEFKVNGNTVQNDTSATYTDASVSNGDIISCVITSNAPCVTSDTASSNSLTITVRTLPSPVITRIGNDTLTTGVYAYYHWTRNGSPLPHDTTRTIVITQDGVYNVLVTDAYGCRDTGASVNVTDLLVGIAQVGDQDNVLLYPNPNSGSFILASNNSTGKEYIITDMIGRVVAERIIKSDIEAIELQGVSAGTYTLAIKGNGSRPFRFEVRQ